ncbi:MAG: hypothetical protein ABIQ16_15305 [Polyangiaceae bacterium]
MKSNATPGSALLHPLSALSLLVLLVNDHWLKRAHPGVLSGKLSDFAVMFLLPVLLHSLFEIAYARKSRRMAHVSTSNRALLCSILLSGLVFALPELWGPAERVYCVAMALLKWPFLAILAQLRGHALPPLSHVVATADVTDLLALSSACLAWRVARRTAPSSRTERQRWAKVVFGALFALVVLSHPAQASAAHSEPYVHDGFYMSFALGPAYLWVHSPASLSNGFQQAIPSTSTGLALAGKLELGGTVSDGLVVGGGIGAAQSDRPIVNTLGERFELSDAQLTLFSLEGFARYYPDPKQGLHLGLNLGFSSLEVSHSSGSQVRGPLVSLEVGHSFWLAHQWSVGISARLSAAELHGDVPGTTVLLMPGVFATIACH